MYSKKQLTPLFDLIAKLAEQPTPSSSGIHSARAETQRLMELDQSLLLVIHEHAHGESYYPVLAAKGTCLSGETMRDMLTGDFDSDREFLKAEHLDEPSIHE